MQGYGNGGTRRPLFTRIITGMGTDGETAGDVIHNPTSGETIVIRKSADQTGGELLAWELRLTPGGKVPSGHTHPEQEERFTLEAGRMRFRVGGQIRVVGPGETVVVPPGTAHHFANVGTSEARVYVETRPALQMEELLRTAALLAKKQRGPRRSIPRPVDFMLFMREFRAEVQSPFFARLVHKVVEITTRLAEKVGIDRHYRRLRNR